MAGAHNAILRRLGVGGGNGNLLRVRCQIIDDAPCGVDMLLRFTGTCLTVQARKSSDPATNAYEGVATGYVEEDADES